MNLSLDFIKRLLSDTGVSSEHAIQAAIENLGGAADAKIESSTVADFNLLKSVIKTSRQ
jgi:hypothetical protein